jgi:hypothetical protein
VDSAYILELGIVSSGISALMQRVRICLIVVIVVRHGAGGSGRLMLQWAREGDIRRSMPSKRDGPQGQGGGAAINQRVWKETIDRTIAVQLEKWSEKGQLSWWVRWSLSEDVEVKLLPRE